MHPTGLGEFMNIFADFTDRVRAAVGALELSASSGGALDVSRAVVEPPRDASHGDLATNAAMVLAKQVGMKPRDLAEKIAERLRDDADVASVEIAGPGFINLRLVPGVWTKVLAAILAEGADYGRSTRGKARKANVEYVSANPTGPMHVGHCRGAVFGDALARSSRFRRLGRQPRILYQRRRFPD